MESTKVVASLEALCLDRVASYVPILQNELEGLPWSLLKLLLPRCDDYRLALIQHVAVKKGLDIQTLWGQRVRARFEFFYIIELKSGLHDLLWQCRFCFITTLSDTCLQDMEWYQMYMDNLCQQKLQMAHRESMREDREVLRKSIDKESVAILKNPFRNGSEDIVQYKPHQLSLDIKTLLALTRSPGALDLLAKHLHTLKCRVCCPSEYRMHVMPALERFMRTLLSRGNLKAMHLEEFLFGGEMANYACLLTMLLLGRLDDQRENDVNTGETASLMGQAIREGNLLESLETSLTSSPQRRDDDNYFREDLYDFCFKEEKTSTGAVKREDPCECCQYVCSTDFQQILNAPDDPRSTLGQSICHLVLDRIKLNHESCTALTNGLVKSASLQSLALLECDMPACGWCKVMSGLALRAQKGLVLQELALTQPLLCGHLSNDYFGQYCAHKLNEMLEAYHMRNHKMKHLKLRLTMRENCHAADNSYLPKYVPSISCLSLHCGERLRSQDKSSPHKLVSPAGLISAIQSKDSNLSDLVLETSSLNAIEVDTLLAATANSFKLKTLNLKRNCYSTSQPKGLLDLLQHSGLRSLDLAECRFSLKECEKEFQDGIVDAMINNSSLQHLNLADPVIGNEDLAILGRAFSETKRTKQQPGYCFNVWHSRFSSRALEQFLEMLSRNVDGCCDNRRLHSLDHLSVFAVYAPMVEAMRSVIPRVSCLYTECLDVVESPERLASMIRYEELIWS